MMPCSPRASPRPLLCPRTLLQTLRALQQQEHDLALLQQQLSAVPRSNPFQRSRTTDLEGQHTHASGGMQHHTGSTVGLHHQSTASTGRLLSSEAASAAVTAAQLQHQQQQQAQQLAQQQQQQFGQQPPLDYEQQLAALQTAHPLAGMPRSTRLLNAMPQRSYSSEALRVGQRPQPVVPLGSAVSASGMLSSASGGRWGVWQTWLSCSAWRGKVCIVLVLVQAGGPCLCRASDRFTRCSTARQHAHHSVA